MNKISTSLKNKKSLNPMKQLTIFDIIAKHRNPVPQKPTDRLTRTLNRWNKTISEKEKAMKVPTLKEVKNVSETR